MKNMSKKERGKTFSCLFCRYPFDASPPDNSYTIPTRFKIDGLDQIKVNYQCEVCKKNNTIYWGNSIPASFLKKGMD